MKARICLVTGGAGFIGSHLVDLMLSHGWEVRVIDKNHDHTNLKQASTSPKLSIITGDILDKKAIDKAINGTSLVFHLAAKTDFNSKNYQDYYSNNVIGTINIAESCKKHKVSKLIFYSSIGSHGVVSSNQRQNELTCFPPQSLYGLSKLEAEAELYKCASSQLNFTIIRPTTVYGSREVMTTLPFIKYLSRYPAIVIGKGKNLVSYVHVDDLNRAAYTASKHRGTINQIYVISGQSVSMIKLTRTILKYLNRTPMVFHAPYWLLYPFALLCTAFSKFTNISTPLPLRRLKTLSLNYDFTTIKAKTDFKYMPRKSLLQGFRQTIDWYYSNHLI